jgi:hypothetical protein
MDDNRPDDHAADPDPGRPRRAPPTIDLEATEVKTSSENVGADNNPGDNAEGETKPRTSSWPSFAALHPFLVAAVIGAVTAAVVIAGVQLVGWPTEAPRPKDGNRRLPRRTRRRPHGSMRWRSRWLRCAPTSQAPVRVRTSFQANSMP